jgi:PST family polysaccharide transporter
VHGFGYWALVGQVLTAGVMSAACAWTVCSWRPGFPRRAGGVREMLAFGRAVTVLSFLGFVIRNVDNVLIGWKWGAAQLGLYKRAYSLLLVPVEQLTGPIASVVVPTLSRVRKEPGEFVAVYRTALLFTAGVGMPIVALLFVSAEDVVALLLGPQWSDAVVMFRALAPAAWVGTTNLALGSTLIALGESRRAARWSSVAACVQVAGFVAGLPWGGVGVALAFSVVTLALRPIGIWYCYRSTFLTPGLFYRTVALPALASAAALVCGLCVRTVLADIADSRALLAVGVPLSVLGTYAIPWFAISSRRQDVTELVRLAASAFKTTAG